jgi:hypothetical protein
VWRIPVAAILFAAYIGFGLATPPGAQAQDKPTLSIPDTEKVQVVRFGQGRDEKTPGFTIDVNGASDPSNPPIPKWSVRGDMISEGGDRIPRNQVSVTQITPNGTGGLNVDVRVDPKGAGAGRYTTVVQFGQGGYANTLPVTIEARLRTFFLWPLLVAGGGWLVGALLKMLSDLFGTAKVTVKAGKKKGLSAWLNAGGWPMLAGGLVGAVIAWAAAYFPSDAWGGNASEWLKLAGAAIGAAVAGTTVADLAKGLRS